MALIITDEGKRDCAFIVWDEKEIAFIVNGNENFRPAEKCPRGVEINNYSLEKRVTEFV